MREPLKVIDFDADCDEIVRRLVTGLVHQWDRVPKHVQGDILKDAVLAASASETGSLREKVISFIHSHAGDRR